MKKNWIQFCFWIKKKAKDKGINVEKWIRDSYVPGKEFGTGSCIHSIPACSKCREKYNNQ